METFDHIKRIAFLGDYLPRQCGIATFTHDLRAAIQSVDEQIESSVIAVNDRPEGYDGYAEEVRFEIAEQDLEAYKRAANYLNFSNFDVVSLQHEFGIYGGTAGSHILTLLRKLDMPVITTLHTILENPTPEQRAVMQELINLSARLVTMSDRGKTFLEEIYQAPAGKIDLIPHGIPDMPFLDPNFFKDQFDADGKYVLLTFGLLSPNKGIENVLRVLPEVVAEFPELLYIVLGATHPNVRRDHGEAYRHQLEKMVVDLNLQKHVVFYDRFVELEELKKFIVAADLYITPYLNRAQITSGTLAYSFGCGKAVISTPYWHAEELLAEGRGVLVPFDDAPAMAEAIGSLLRDKARRHGMRKRAYLLGREMVWSNVGSLYLDSFDKARSGAVAQFIRSAEGRKVGISRKKLPELRLDHLIQLSDNTGILQLARFSVPRYEHGYRVADNARALLLCILLEEIGVETKLAQRLGKTYAALLDFAFQAEGKRFNSLLNFDRHWGEATDSDDTDGQVLWALGVCVGRSKSRGLQIWAAQLFEQALPLLPELSSPRAWAFGLLGIHAYMQRFEGNRTASQIRENLTQQLLQRYESNADEAWPWFEDTVTYDNAKLPHALLLSSNEQAIEVGLNALRWLVSIQTAESGHFRPIGRDGWYPRNGTRSLFDQQPIEAYSTVSACLEAFRITRDFSWLETARSTFDWFLGSNDLGQPLCDPAAGACCDGLQVDRLNQNQGAESTLAYLLSLAEMQQMENLFATHHNQLIRYENTQ